MNRLIATCFGLGHLRPAPGTWASAVAVALGLAIDHWLGFPALVVATLLAVVIGYRAVAATLASPADDPAEFVIDEVAGQWLALLFPAAAFWLHGVENWPMVAWPGWVAAFAFFRLFDIWKPWLVGRLDRRGGALGVMGDDLVAGLFAGIALMGAAGLYHGLIEPWLR